MQARLLHITGVVQGVGFRPFVYRLAQRFQLGGWVLNGETGVEIHIEGDVEQLESFLQALITDHPPAAVIGSVDIQVAHPEHYSTFSIRESHKAARPTVRISPDLAVCDTCLTELFDPADRHYHYPYINCTDCGPRYSIITSLPYDRPATTMQPFVMCQQCHAEYHDPGNRRFHAQPTACPACGPSYYLLYQQQIITRDVLATAVSLLHAGNILAVKGIGGYHLACDAQHGAAVTALRERKFRKEKPFALMVKDLDTARALTVLDKEHETLLTAVARPIVVAEAKFDLPGVAPDNRDLGVMLPYTPLHHLLFAAGAPEILVMTSANRSSEPIAYTDVNALETLGGIADAFLIGERPIARRVDDAIVRHSSLGPQLLRRARGYAPSSVTQLPDKHPMLAVGGDLKSSFTLSVLGEAFVSQHLGDLEHLEAYQAFTESIEDLLRMYELDVRELTVVHDLHPEYRSSQFAQSLPAKAHLAVQHHIAHIASVLAEHRQFDTRVLGLALDGTGYGSDGAIWGGEAFVGSLMDGFERAAHLKYAALVGGDAAASYPVQAAVGFLQGFDIDFCAPPFTFPERYLQATQLLDKGLRVFQTSSAGRLFDTAAALLGFTRPITHEGQAAMWLEHLARTSQSQDAYAFPLAGDTWDYHPLLTAVISERQKQRDVSDIARAFIRGLADGLVAAARQLAETYQLETIALSGGVFQNDLLLRDIAVRVASTQLRVLVNHQVPCNDGGVSLGQAAVAALSSQ